MPPPHKTLYLISNLPRIDNKECGEAHHECWENTSNFQKGFFVIKTTGLYGLVFFLLSACGSSSGAETAALNVCKSNKILLSNIHLSIKGSGLFTLSDENETEERYTRKGEFCVDEKGTIKHASGDTLLMTLPKENGSLNGASRGLAKIALSDADGAAITSLSFDENGIVTGHYGLDETQLLGQITTAHFNSPQNLLAIENDRCSATEDSGTSIISPPNTPASGSIQSGTLAGQYECNRGSGFFNTWLTVRGDAYFRLNHEGTTLYSKTIKIGTDKQGLLVNASGHHVTGHAANSSGQILDELVNFNLSHSSSPPATTSTIQLSINLSANSPIPSNTAFNAADATTYTHQTAINIFDSLGSTHALSFYFLKTNIADNWTLYSVLNPAPTNTNKGQLRANGLSPLTLTFHPDGSLASPTSVFFEDLDPIGGAIPNQVVSLDLSTLTQNIAPFEVTSTTQNGWAAGALTDIIFSENGLILGHFSNGLTNVTLGEFVLAIFPNPSGLQPFDTNTFIKTTRSGSPTLGTANTEDFGTIDVTITN